MNHRAEAKRLASCAKMDNRTFRHEIEMALENATTPLLLRLKEAEFALEQISALSGRRMPKTVDMMRIYEITKEYKEGK